MTWVVVPPWFVEQLRSYMDRENEDEPIETDPHIIARWSGTHRTECVVHEWRYKPVRPPFLPDGDAHRYQYRFCLECGVKQELEF